jgi:predicted DNA-binding transcriptional regulator AlpA
MSAKQWLLRRDVTAKTRLSTSTIRRLEIAGDFPKHFVLNGRALYDASHVDAWMSDKQAEAMGESATATIA